MIHLRSAFALLAVLPCLVSCDPAGEADAGALDAPRADVGSVDAPTVARDAPLADAEVAALDAFAAMPDAFEPAMGCAGSTALFCEDFEALPEGVAMSERWRNEVRNGSLHIDHAQARGTRALHVHTDDNGMAFMRLAFAPPGNSYFGRMWLYVNAFPSAPNWAHYTLVQGSGTGAGVIRPVGGQFAPAGGGRAAGAYWGIGSDGGPTGDWTNWRTSAPSQGGRWACVEWEMDASENFIRVTFDGVANDDLTVNTTMHGGNAVDFVFPAFDTLRIGWQLYQAGTTPAGFDLWIDDLVLDTTRVGCD